MTIVKEGTTTVAFALVRMTCLAHLQYFTMVPQRNLFLFFLYLSCAPSKKHKLYAVRALPHTSLAALNRAVRFDALAFQTFPSTLVPIRGVQELIRSMVTPVMFVCRIDAQEEGHVEHGLSGRDDASAYSRRLTT